MCRSPPPVNEFGNREDGDSEHHQGDRDPLVHFQQLGVRGLDSKPDGDLSGYCPAGVEAKEPAHGVEIRACRFLYASQSASSIGHASDMLGFMPAYPLSSHKARSFKHYPAERGCLARGAGELIRRHEAGPCARAGKVNAVR